MPSKEINFFIDYPGASIKGKKHIRNWILALIQDYPKDIAFLNFIFVDDNALLEMNKEYLQHDYYTDIITFDQSDTASTIEGDIYISIDRLVENADANKVTPFDELSRLMAHGVLHLLGFDDKSPDGKKEMTELEDSALLLRPQYVSRGTLEITHVS